MSGERILARTKQKKRVRNEAAAGEKTDQPNKWEEANPTQRVPAWTALRGVAGQCSCTRLTSIHRVCSADQEAIPGDPSEDEPGSPST
eukprot:scaffold1681_cov237-Pinguiococcus_pyrenoidosus.AAC.3